MAAISGYLNQLTAYQDVGLFLMRLLAGFLFTYSGFHKIQKVKQFATQNKLPLFIAVLVVLAELFGGLGLLLGIFTQIAALLIMAVMTGSMFTHIVIWHSPYWAEKGGWEYDLMWFSMCVVVLLTGGGSIAIYPTLSF